MHSWKLILVLVASAMISGCASYIPPSGRADFSNFRNPEMRAAFAAKPAAGFPAGVTAVRVQAPGYRSYSTQRDGGVYGSGRYSVILTKELEEGTELERLKKLPELGGLISISSLLLPDRLNSDEDLRQAAARLKSDMLLIYTFDTSFFNNDLSTTLNVISLGISPTRKVQVNVTASGLLMDTRTGFIYAALEANEKREVRTNAWESKETADRARLDAEKTAFKSLVGEFEKSWGSVVERAKKGA
jgi:hypothetical protein